jgi:outer membrane protein assembly factor BamB
VEESLRPQGVDAAVLGVAGARQGPLRLFFLLPWNQRLNGRYLASLVAGDGKVYGCSKEGDVVVVAAGDKYQELSRTNLGERILATPAVAQGNVLIRTAGHLYCFRAAP